MDNARKLEANCDECDRIPGGNSYGYRIIRRPLDNGSASTGEREIDPPQAEIVQRIFNEYTEGLSRDKSLGDSIGREFRARAKGDGTLPRSMEIGSARMEY